MRAGRMWVWLVLAAVFSMHGLPNLAADTGHTDGGSVHEQLAYSHQSNQRTLPKAIREISPPTDVFPPTSPRPS